MPADPELQGQLAAIAAQLRQRDAQLDALLRLAGRREARDLAALGRLDDPADAAFDVFSRFGEDGILQYLIRAAAVPPSARCFVEIGAGDYRAPSTRFLLINDGWRGLAVDRDADAVERLRRHPLCIRHGLTPAHGWVTRETIDEVLEAGGVATGGELGLLVLGLRGNDYWLWDALSIVAPLLVVAGYNALFGAERSVLVPYDPHFARQQAHYSRLYFGASLAALCQLAERKGYALVGTAPSAVQAYFVRRDRLGELAARTASEAFRPARLRESRDPLGHPSFLAGESAARIIAHRPLVDLDDGQRIRVRDLFPALEGEATRTRPPRDPAGLRVLLHARPDAQARPGGDMAVLQQLKLGLARLGCAVNVSQDPNTGLDGYDIVHLFNLAHMQQAAHIEACARQALAQDLPYVITALVEDQPRYLAKALLAYQLLRHYLDLGQPRGRLPELLRMLDGAAPTGMATLSFVAHHAARILVSGQAEQATIARLHPEVPIAHVPFGSSVTETDIGPDAFIDRYGVRDFVLCVGRLEPRKNQLMLLAALEDDDVPVVCIAGDLRFQPDYAEQCRRFGRRAPTLFLDRLAPEMLVSAYRAARVHCLPSWYELPGLVTLEAARYGAAVVASRWGTIEDYLGDACRTCEPGDPASIRRAVHAALEAGPLPQAAESAARWTWERHAREVLAVYEAVLAGADAHEQAVGA